ncbi:MAG TPA: FixH family protein [Kofleriaceae bacterium]
MAPRVKWILAIIALLAGNVVAMIVLAVVASDGATQVIPAYYDKAAHFDDEIDRATASRALGWHAEVAIAGGAIDVTVSDAAGRAVDGARVRITGYQRAHASEPLDVVLATIGAGRYRGDVRERRGWHDLIVAADRGGAHYVQHVAIEAR